MSRTRRRDHRDDRKIHRDGKKSWFRGRAQIVRSGDLVKNDVDDMTTTLRINNGRRRMADKVAVIAGLEELGDSESY